MADFNPRFVPDLAAIDKLLKGPESLVGVNMRSRSQIALAAARAGAPKRSGRLAEELVAVEQTVDGDTWFEIFSTASYAKLVSEGTKPHPIEAKDGGVLHFQVGGVDVFVTSVYHPGTEPNPYLVEALVASMGNFP